jgi:glucose-1-phosphate thymidylyltransferase
MKLIIPMAGMGKRMRPHTLITPKPLLKIAGKSLVQRIAEDLKISTNDEFDEIHYIVGDFGEDIESELLSIATNIGSKGFIHYQDEPLGTAHAIYCAKEALRGDVIVAFADTLFEGDFTINKSDEGIIWTMRVDKPENYGVVLTDNEKRIYGFSEKPKSFISDEAIIGIYYFKEAKILKKKIETLFKKEALVKGEYQLTDALDMLLEDNMVIKSANIKKWLDCGNKDEFLRSAKSILGKENPDNKNYKNTEIINPVYIGNNVSIEHAKIGPFVIVEDNTDIKDSKIDNSVIFENCKIVGSEISNSMLGNNTLIKNAKGILNIGDFSTYEN